MRFLATLSLIALVASISFGRRPGDGPITVFLAGDSTMAEKLPERRPETGWGEALQKAFDERKVRIENLAQNGRSSKSFIAENRWQALVARLHQGDYVFIQFGHNDESKDKGDRYSTLAEFRNNLLRFVSEVRDRKAIPVLLTPVMRRRFDSQGNFQDTHGEYPEIVRQVAAGQKVALIDLHRLSEQVIKQYGPEGSRKLFLQLKPGENPNFPTGVEDNTHFSPLGAEIIAGLAIEEIKQLHLGLAKALKKGPRGHAT